MSAALNETGDPAGNGDDWGAGVNGGGNGGGASSPVTTIRNHLATIEALQAEAPPNQMELADVHRRIASAFTKIAAIATTSAEANRKAARNVDMIDEGNASFYYNGEGGARRRSRHRSRHRSRRAGNAAQKTARRVRGRK